jgi:hypothetical protein
MEMDINMDLDMQHEQGHAAWTGTWTSGLHFSMLHVHVHAACSSRY